MGRRGREGRDLSRSAEGIVVASADRAESSVSCRRRALPPSAQTSDVVDKKNSGCAAPSIQTPNPHSFARISFFVSAIPSCLTPSLLPR